MFIEFLITPDFENTTCDCLIAYNNDTITK